MKFLSFLPIGLLLVSGGNALRAKALVIDLEHNKIQTILFDTIGIVLIVLGNLTMMASVLLFLHFLVNSATYNGQGLFNFSL